MDMLNELMLRRICSLEELAKSSALFDHGRKSMGVSCIFMLTEFMLGNKIGNDCMTIAFNGLSLFVLTANSIPFITCTRERKTCRY